MALNQSTGCLNCGKPLKGRTDKKFCDDYCRNNYNNRLRRSSSNLVRNINNALAKNRRIIENFLSEGGEVTKIKKDKLIEAGFHFKYSTHTYTNKKGNIYIFCYDMGYLRLDNEWYLLVKRKS